MPVIYYTYYTPISHSIPAICDQEHALGRKLLAKGLKDLYDIQFSSEDLPSGIGAEENGKPYLIAYPGICFNISHCDGLVVCAFHNRPLGIDAELPDSFADVLINRVLSEQEKGFLQTAGTTLPLRQEWFYRLWTLKEAYVKKSGVGVDTDLTDFSFSFTESGEHLNVLCSDTSVSCFQTMLPHGQILSLCYEGKDEEITLIDQTHNI